MPVKYCDTSDSNVYSCIANELNSNIDDLNFVNCLPFQEVNNEDFERLFSPVNQYDVSLNGFNFEDESLNENEEDTHSNPPVKYYLSSEFNEIIDNSVNQNFSIIHFNARSMFRNFEEIHAYLSNLQYQFSVIGISETWINSNSHVPFVIEGYTFVHVDRPSGRGGGVGLFIRKDLNYKLVQFSEQCEGVDCLCIEIDCKTSKNIVVAIIYRQPKSNVIQFSSFFDKLMNYNEIKNKRAYLMGDLNIDLMKKYTNSQIFDFINTVASSGFYPIINRPTRVNSRSATNIDNIYTNVFCSSIISGIFVTDITDHFPIFYISHFLDRVNNSKSKSFSFRKVTIENCNRLSVDLANADWSEVYQENDTERAYDVFYEKFIGYYNEHFPVQTKHIKKRKRNRKPWVSLDMLKLIKTKNKLYKNYLKRSIQANYDKYKKLRNMVTTRLRRAKRDYYFKKFDSVKNNSKKTWTLINEILGKQKSAVEEGKSFCHNGSYISNPDDIAENFNEYFVNIGSNIANCIAEDENAIDTFNAYMGQPSPHILFFKPVTKEEIIDIVKSNLKSGKSCGFDEIDSIVVKHILPFIVEPLLYICNSSLRTGCVPSKMKISKVVPIFKKDDPSLFTNYRPISILPCFSKILEKLVFNRLYDYLLQHNFLYDSQYGFRQNYSTDMAVIEIHDRIVKELNEGKSVIGVFMDLSKAFDSLSHDILLQKMQHYGIKGLSLKWFQSYLLHRQQFTVYNSHNSSFGNINTGVPQGSILGPLLFLIYINDIVNSCHECDCILYADDTSLLASHNDIEALVESLNTSLAHISAWFKCNKLSLNTSKTQCVLFKKGGVQFNVDDILLKIDAVPLKFYDSVKFLGVVLNSSLSWKDHIDLVRLKISRFIGILSRLKYELPSNILFLLYNAYVLSHLSYCNSIWGNTYSSHLHKLIMLQKKAIRVCTKSEYTASTSTLFKLLYTLKLQDINKIQIASFMQRFHSQTLSPYLMNMFVKNRNIHNYNTRSCNHFHRWTYLNNKSKYSLRHTGPILWNSLNLSNFNIQFNNSFKRQYKKYLIGNY